MALASMTSRRLAWKVALVLALVAVILAVALYERRPHGTFALSVAQCLADRSVCSTKVPLMLSGAIVPGSQVRQQGGCATALELHSPGSPATDRIPVCVDHELQPFRFYFGDEQMRRYLERGVVRADALGSFDGSRFNASDVYVVGSDWKYYAFLYGP